MRQGDSAYLRHILDAVSRIQEYTEDMNREDFLASNLHQDAVIRQVEVIGKRPGRYRRRQERGIPRSLGRIWPG